MGAKQSKALKRVLTETTIGTRQLEELWRQYAVRKSEGAEAFMTRSDAAKFMRDLAVELNFVCSDSDLDELIGELIAKCDPDDSNAITFDSFVSLFIQAQRVAMEPDASTGAVKPAFSITQSLMFTSDVEQALAEVRARRGRAGAGASASAAATVFGVPLRQAARLNAANPFVPAPLYLSCRWLETTVVGSTRTIDEEGLYRVPGSATKFEKYKKLFDNGVAVDYAELDERCAENVALVVIKYLKALPADGGLVPPEHLSRLLKLLPADQWETMPADALDAIRAVLVDLPVENRATLYFLAAHFRTVAANEQRNKMGRSNIERTLGITSGPSVSKVIALLLIFADLHAALLAGETDPVLLALSTSSISSSSSSVSSSSSSVSSSSSSVSSSLSPVSSSSTDSSSGALPPALPSSQPPAIPPALPSSQPPVIPPALPSSQPPAIPPALPSSQPPAISSALPSSQPPATPSALPSSQPPTLAPPAPLSLSAAAPVKRKRTRSLGSHRGAASKVDEPPIIARPPGIDE